MRRCLLAVVILLGAKGLLRASEPTPLWTVDLRALDVKENEDSVVVLSGPLLMVYPSLSRPALVFETGSGKRNSSQAQLHSSSPPAVAQTEDLPGKSGVIVARRKQISVIQICDQPVCAQPPGKPSVRDSKFYLRAPGRPDTLIWEAHCLPRLPVLLADNRILVFGCDVKSSVVDGSGRRVYQLPVFTMPFFAPSSNGSRFAVYERDSSLLHQFEGTDRLRLRVYRASDGKKLFEMRWKLGNDAINDGRVALSDDGGLLAVVRAGQLLVFSLPL